MSLSRYSFTVRLYFVSAAVNVNIQKLKLLANFSLNKSGLSQFPMHTSNNTTFLSIFYVVVFATVP